MLVAGLFFTILGASAHADEVEEPTTVDSIVVRGILPGPAWWRVSDSDSTVHILVIPEAAPAKLAWDAAILDARMQRARLLVMPAAVSVGVTQIPGLFRTYKGEMLDKRPLEETLPQPLRSRFVAARTASGLTGPQVARFRPAYAAQRLEHELRKRQDIAGGDIAKRVGAAARQRRVRKSTPLVSFKPARVAWDPIAAVDGLKRERDCLAQTLQTMAPLVDAQRQAALDWAAGDVRGLLALPRLSHRASCDNDLLSRVDRTHRPELLRAQIEAIQGALKTPGETIAVVDPGLLLSVDGVLMTLKNQGFEIRTPANITEP